ncbi:hypothetical protein [Gloeobacter kilaueensis]|uniref:Uncharacterized protein n=1 Tax=Gloeobacter kilaueensis (strain ATCC BAA-2537 / CCAP 1431/1 / ULC 316 / JS1) TaxID=1183438 RepID=U5QGN2_GLOK1|nr:hypothetical protein [Gloeobacter kilaueensis]AGY58038.1 hypothetical protein GKIL_1792 [Gloeobacter kilaueensis JS1]
MNNPTRHQNAPAVAVASLLLLAATLFVATPVRSAPEARIAASAPLLVRYKISSGKCGDSLCNRTYTIDRGGLLSYTDPAGKVVEKTLSKEELTALSGQIDGADYQQLRSNRTEYFECPSAAGGQDVTYTFYTARGSQMISNCNIKFDATSPPFAKLQEIIDHHLPPSQ